MFERAETAVKEAYGADNVGDVGAGELKGLLAERNSDTTRKLPETLTPSPEEDIPGPPSAGEDGDWFPEDATVRVWHADGREPGDFLVAALHENGIRCRMERGEGEQLYVVPADAERAREIVREVMEGRPPE